MKVTILHIVEWIFLPCLVLHSNGLALKKHCSVGQIRINGVCREIPDWPNPQWSGGDRVQPPEYIYLGSIVSDPSQPEKANKYFVSTIAKTWDDAKEHCIELTGGIGGGIGSTGGIGGLAAIETEEENNDLNELLETHGLGGLLWLGGSYDQQLGHYAWSGSEEPINGTGWTYTPWGLREPPFTPTSQTRALLYHEGPHHSEWSTAASTARLRYICEGGTDDNKKPSESANKPPKPKKG